MPDSREWFGVLLRTGSLHNGRVYGTREKAEAVRDGIVWHSREGTQVVTLTAAPPLPAGRPEEATFWLIEYDGARPHKWAITDPEWEWTTDASKATRFTTRDEAARRAHSHWEWVHRDCDPQNLSSNPYNYVATEHVFIGSSLPAGRGSEVSEEKPWDQQNGERAMRVCDAVAEALGLSRTYDPSVLPGMVAHLRSKELRDV